MPFSPKPDAGAICVEIISKAPVGSEKSLQSRLYNLNLMYWWQKAQGLDGNVIWNGILCEPTITPAEAGI